MKFLRKVQILLRKSEEILGPTLPLQYYLDQFQYKKSWKKSEK